MARQNKAGSTRKSHTARLSHLHRATSILSGLGSIGILGLIVLINADVGGRYLFNSPVNGVPEIVSLSIVVIIYLQIAHSVRMGRFIRSDMVINRITKRFPRTGLVLHGIHNLAGVAATILIFYFVYPAFVEAYVTNEYVGSFGSFTAPVWPMGLVVLIGMAATAFQYTVLAWQDLKAGFIGGSGNHADD